MDLLNGVISIHGVTYLLFVAFIIIALGYMLGRIRIKGIDLGTAGVFLVALLAGCFFYSDLDKEVSSIGSNTKDLLRIIENMGLILFVTSVGFIAGPHFFTNLKKHFRSYVAIGFIIIFSGTVAAILCILFGRMTGASDPHELTAMVSGIFAGALTSTPAFSAARASVPAQYEDIVSVGYGIAYIFGVVGVVLFVQIVPKLKGVDLKEELKKMDALEPAGARRFSDKDLIHIDPFGIAPFAIAVILGVIIGMIRIPLSSKGLGGTCFSLTTTGGCLLVSLVIAHFGKIGRISLTPYHDSLKVFREFGLALFLTGAGLSGGASFIQHFQFQYFIYGIIITCVSMVVGYLFAAKVLKLNILNALSSVTGGMTSTPALGTLISTAGSENVASAYAATYPVALILVVLATQFLSLAFG